MLIPVERAVWWAGMVVSWGEKLWRPQGAMEPERPEKRSTEGKERVTGRREEGEVEQV